MKFCSQQLLLPLVLKLHSSVSDAAWIELLQITADGLMNVRFLKTSKLLLTLYLPINIQHTPIRVFCHQMPQCCLTSLSQCSFITLCLCVDVSMTNSSACHYSSESFISLIRDAFIPFEGLQTPQRIEGFLQTDGYTIQQSDEKTISCCL